MPPMPKRSARRLGGRRCALCRSRRLTSKLPCCCTVAGSGWCAKRTGLVNALRGHLAEFGVIAPQGLRNVGKLIAIVRDEGDARLPDLARQVLQVLAAQIEQLEAAVAAIEKQLMAWHKSNPVSQRLASVPGIGPIIATAIAATVVEPSGLRSGREFAAWLGLVPRQNSTGGKHRLGGISKRGNPYLRRLLINGA